MPILSFLSYQKTFSRKHSYTHKPPPSLIKTVSCSSSFNHGSWSFHPNVQEMKKVFDKYDADKDGKISLAEYRAALRATAGPLDEAAARRMFAEADKDGDGFVDFEEFVGVNMEGGGVKMGDIRSAFRVFDLDRDGRISAEELAEVLRRIGGFGGEEECGVEACRRMVRAVDKDGDGLIDMEEFVAMMTRTMKLVSN